MFEILFTLVKNIKMTIILVVIVSGAAIILSSRCSRIENEAKELRALYINEQKTSQSWKDAAGFWHNRVQVTVFSSNAVLRELAATRADLAGLHEKFSGVKSDLKNLTEYSKASENSRYQIAALVRDTVYAPYPGDTLRSRTFLYSDKWVTLSGYFKGDSIYSTISTRDSIENVVYWKRKWFLARKQYFQEVKSLNPHTQVKYSDIIMVKPERKRFLGMF